MRTLLYVGIFAVASLLLLAWWKRRAHTRSKCTCYLGFSGNLKPTYVPELIPINVRSEASNSGIEMLR